MDRIRAAQHENFVLANELRQIVMRTYDLTLEDSIILFGFLPEFKAVLTERQRSESLSRIAPILARMRSFMLATGSTEQEVDEDLAKYKTNRE